MILSLSSDTGATTSKIYPYNQAKLLARSGNEIAVLMIENGEIVHYKYDVDKQEILSL